MTDKEKDQLVEKVMKGFDFKRVHALNILSDHQLTDKTMDDLKSRARKLLLMHLRHRDVPDGLTARAECSNDEHQDDGHHAPDPSLILFQHSLFLLHRFYVLGLLCSSAAVFNTANLSTSS